MEKTIELREVRAGGAFTLDGVEFVKLGDDPDALWNELVLTRDVVMKNIPFENDDAEREEHNNYVGSNLEKQSVRWLRDKHSTILENAVELPINLITMDGMIDYGCPPVLVRSLTIDEYRRYRRFIPLASKPYWLATGWTTASSPISGTRYAYYIGSGGSVKYEHVYSAYFAPRPALYLKPSILVSIDDGEAKEKVIRDYTDTELMDELFRRRRESYDLNNLGGRK